MRLSPRFLGQALRRVAKSVRYYILYAGHARLCPVCGHWSRRFGAAGQTRRGDAKCMYCSSLERHRMVWLFFERRTELFAGGVNRMLHVAPEGALAERLRRRVGAGYLSADLHDPTAMVSMDITQIHYPDATFDAIYCSHVLQYVSDDRKAMAELRRVLRADGWAVILAPVSTAPQTIEGDAAANGYDTYVHLRRYGQDFVQRLEDSGLDVQVVRPEDFLTAEEIRTMSVGSDAIYYCVKR